MNKDELTKEAQAGEVDAQYLLATSYSRLDPEWEMWLTRAAEGGHVEAQYALGSEANTNIGGVLDDGVYHFFEEAKKWLRRAAENGHPAACMELAGLEIWSRFHDPIGVAEGAEWYKKGRGLGHEDDPDMLSILTPPWLLDPYTPKPGPDRTGAKSGKLRAQFDVGCLCAYEQKMIEAYAWFWVAARDLRHVPFDTVFRTRMKHPIRRTANIQLESARSFNLLEAVFNDEEAEQSRRLAEKYLIEFGPRPWWKKLFT